MNILIGLNEIDEMLNPPIKFWKTTYSRFGRYYDEQTPTNNLTSLKQCCAFYIKIEYNKPDEVVKDCIEFVDKIKNEWNLYFKEKERQQEEQKKQEKERQQELKNY